MELVYLWVEDYKNIKGEGFNFSPQFHCEFKDEYDEENRLKNNCNLIIETQEYIKDFFGENINVTAIVGKNGSGKSTVLEVLSSLLLNKDFEKKIYLVVYNDEKLQIFKNNLEFVVNTSIDYEIFELSQISKSDIFGVYYSSNFTNGSLDTILELFTTPRIITHEKSQFSHGHGYENSNLKVQSLLNLVFNSNRLLEPHPTDSAYYAQHAFMIDEMQNNYKLAKTIVILDFLRKFGKEYLPIGIRKSDRVIVSIQSNKNTNTTARKTFIERIDEFLSVEPDENYRDQYIEFKTKFLSIIEQNLTSDDICNLFIDDALDLIHLYIDLYRLNKNLTFEFLDMKIKDFSSGEENLTLMFALLLLGIVSYLKQGNKSCNILLLLDEIENNFHPKWQRLLFSNIISFLKVIQESHNDNQINFTILLASHSPFILSDLPSRNVIFLDKNQEGNCNVVNGLENKKQTFGANIHTLLSDGFFMDEGLMGEFAKRKIQNVYKFLKKQESEISSKEEAQEIINIIGEPIIEKQLQIIFDKVFSEENEIDSEIIRLEKRLNELKKKKNDNN